MARTVRDKASGVCQYCAEAFGVKDEVRACSAPRSNDFEGNPGSRKLPENSCQVMTFWFDRDKEKPRMDSMRGLVLRVRGRMMSPLA